MMLALSVSCMASVRLLLHLAKEESVGTAVFRCINCIACVLFYEASPAFCCEEDTKYCNGVLDR